MPRAGENYALEPFLLYQTVIACHETAHAVPEQEIRYVRIFLLRFQAQGVRVLNQRIKPALAEVPELFCAFAVPKVVVADDQDTRLVQSLGGLVVTVDMLGHAVQNLHDGPDITLGLPNVLNQFLAGYRAERADGCLAHASHFLFKKQPLRCSGCFVSVYYLVESTAISPLWIIRDSSSTAAFTLSDTCWGISSSAP